MQNINKISPFLLFMLVMYTINAQEKIQTNPEIVKDIEGNEYKTITLGEQVWLQSDLITSTYNDGTKISLVEGNLAWESIGVQEAMCWYKNTKNSDGALYNWHAVKTGKLCPVGWHVPVDSEYVNLTKYLIKSGFNYDKSKVGNKVAKSLSSTNQWTLSVARGTIGHDLQNNNLTNWSALPGGYRYFTGFFYSKNQEGFWWTSSDANSINAICYSLGYNHANFIQYVYDKKDAFSVRCLKD